MSERVVLTRAHYCEKCGVLLAPLEEWARVCMMHMTDEQARAISLRPTPTEAPINDA